jgi:DNA-binding transcriptional LysR family regulator
MARNETKYMESAIALSEELNFTLAAEKIHVSQPTITKNIKGLEKRLGFELFERGHKIVKPTDASRAYVEKARLSLLYGEQAFQAARAAKENAEVVLNVGKSPYTDPFLTSTLLSIQLPLFPRLRIELTSQYSCDLAHEVLAGGLDLAIATEPPESPLLTTVKVMEAPFYIAMSKRDELAGQPSVTLDCLAGRSWVLFERRLHPPLYDAVIHLAEERKIVPAKIQHITTPEESFQFIADGSGVAFLVKAGALIMARNGITVRPLVEKALLLKTYLASRADNESKVASELVRAFMRKLSDLSKGKQLSSSMSA